MRYFFYKNTKWLHAGLLKKPFSHCYILYLIPKPLLEQKIVFFINVIKIIAHLILYQKIYSSSSNVKLEIVYFFSTKNYWNKKKGNDIAILIGLFFFSLGHVKSMIVINIK